MRVLGIVAVLLLLPVPFGLAGVVSEACSGGETDSNAVALGVVDFTRVPRNAPPGGLYITPAGTPDADRIWRETNDVRGLQKTVKVCDVSEIEGATYTLLYRYTVPSDAAVREPEQAVP